MTFFLVTIRHDQECDIMELDDLLFPWAWSCTRLFLSVDFGRRIHSVKSKFPPAQYIVFSRFFLKYLCPYSPCVRSVRPPGLLHN